MKGWSEIGFGPGTLRANAQSLANEVAPFGCKSNASLGRELAAAGPGGVLSQASNSPAVCQGWGPGPQATWAHRGTPQGLPVTAEGARLAALHPLGAQLLRFLGCGPAPMASGTRWPLLFMLQSGPLSTCRRKRG